MAHKAASLLFLHAQTSLHPGSGTALGTVDLPVQRERHTNWPLIPSSSLKGVLRDACREQVVSNGKTRDQANEDAQLEAAFGPGKAEESSSHSGAVVFTDARLLAFPVRSLSGVFAWVTCPSVLQRLQRDLGLANLAPEGWEIPPVTESKAAYCHADSPLLVEGKMLILEEFEYSRAGDCDAVAQWIQQHASAERDSVYELQKRLVVLHDDAFGHFVQYATEVTARIGLNYQTKTVKQGALFYQEFLPPETLFYGLVLAHDGRSSKSKENGFAATSLLKFVQHAAGSVIQIGGDETTGKGLCAVHFHS